MRHIDAGRLGTDIPPEVVPVDTIDVPSPLRPWLAALAPSGGLRPVQADAVRHLVGTRRNLLVPAPTGAGKTLIGDIALATGLARGRRVALLEPLRALAHDRARAWRSRLPHLPGTPRIAVATGSLPLEGEHLDAPPPAGDVVIATPERFAGLLRGRVHDAWLRDLAVVVVDEAHLLADPHRGPVVEEVLTALLALATPPRLVLLSASLGPTTAHLGRWLRPCDVVPHGQRHPALDLGVVEPDANDTVADIVRRLADPGRSTLVFVYRRRDADGVAAALGAVAYHAGTADKASIRDRFAAGDVPVLVTTTALGLGVDLPADDVIVAHTTRWGQGRIEAPELLQMAGRAGRRRAGRAWFAVGPAGSWGTEELATALQAPPAPLRSAVPADPDRAIAALLARGGPQTPEGLARLARATLAGDDLVPELAGAVDRLARRLLVTPAPAIALTPVGAAAARSQLPLALAAGYARLVHDLVAAGLTSVLDHWTAADHVLVACLCDAVGPETAPAPQPPSALLDQLGDRMPEVLGSLGLAPGARASRLVDRATRTTSAVRAYAARDPQRMRERLAFLGRGLAVVTDALETSSITRRKLRRTALELMNSGVAPPRGPR